MAQIDWRFMQPLDQSNQIAAMASGNQQINAGLAAMGGAVTGYADALKQRNTDSILNALYQAQTSADLPNALSAVQALQQQYGRGYDQAAVRNAIDTRGSTLGQRDLQAINLQQAQAAQAAIPQIAAFNAQRMKAAGATPEQINALNAIQGIDNSTMAQQQIGDLRDSRDFTERQNNRAADVAFRNLQQLQQQQNWQADYDLRTDKDDFERGRVIAAENPARSMWSTDAAGNAIPVNSAGVSTLDAYSAMKDIRGIRNNNPGNLNFAGQAGATRENGSGRFASFNSPEEGLSALSKQLDLHFTGKSAKAKEAGRPLNTVAGIIEAWAPPNENNTKKYIADVAKELGVSPNAVLNHKDPKVKTALMQAIVRKENGGNPYTPAQYAAGIAGGRGQQGGVVGGVPQAAVSKVTAAYQNSIADATKAFSTAQANARAKGSIANTGKNVDTWLASKGETSLFGGSTNPMFTRSADIAKMARAEPLFNDLPSDQQIKILDAAYGYVNSTGLFEYTGNKELKSFIKNESSAVKQNAKNQLTVAKNAAMEQGIQSMIQAYQQAGQRPPTRESIMQMLDPQAPKQQAPKAQPVPTATAPTKAATTAPVKAANEKAASKASTPKPDKQAIVDFMVKKGTNVYPDGLDGVKDRTLIREAATEARKVIEANKVKAQQTEKAKEEARKKQSLAEIDRLKKTYADKQAAKISAERKKQEEQRKLWEQKKLEEQQKLSKLFSPRV